MTPIFGRTLIQRIGATGLTPAAAPLLGQRVRKEIHALQTGEFTRHPERSPRGPVSVIVSLDEQRVHVY